MRAILALACAISLSLPAHAEVVIYFGQGESQTQCIEFNEERISGLTLLERSSFQMVNGQVGPGIAVCMVDAVGCSNPQNCFCNLQMFWSYWHLENGAWVYSNVGAGIYENVVNGSV